MDYDESFASLFSDSPCSFQELMEVPDTNDEAHPHALHNSTEPTATQQKPTSEGRDQPQEGTLRLLQLSEWDQDKSYGDDPPRYIRYTMLWKVTRNGKRIMKGSMLESHDDVPDSFRAQLYAAEAQKSNRKRATPGDLTEASLLPPPMTAGTSTQVLNASMTSSLDIPGFKDDAVKDYVQYLQGQWRSQEYKDQFKKAGNVVLDGYIDLDQVYKEQQPDFFTDCDVELGAAKLFIKYIPDFAKRRKLNSSILAG